MLNKFKLYYELVKGDRGAKAKSKDVVKANKPKDWKPAPEGYKVPVVTNKFKDKPKHAFALRPGDLNKAKRRK